MTTFTEHVEDYLRLRRSFGYRLDEAARLLPRFAVYLEAADAEFVTVIALWLGHADTRSTQPYIHADMTIKERALALVTPVTARQAATRPPTP